MAQKNKIDVLIYPVGEEDVEPLGFRDVNYISFVSSPGGQGEGTYGIPALLTERRVKEEGLPVKILYVNPANIACMEATRTA